MDLNEMTESWMTSYLSREMMLPDVMRLWGERYHILRREIETCLTVWLPADVYFSIRTGQAEYQTYVCLAILALCNEALQELDRSEARSMALALPALDMDRLLSQADLIQRNLTSLD